MENVNVSVTPDGRLSRTDAAKFLGLSSKTLANWLSRGLGPKSIRVGGRRFYFLDDLMGFITESTHRTM